MPARKYVASCQSGSWKKAQGSSGGIGQYYLKINGYSSTYFGYGKLDGDKFSGNIQCTTNSKCGAGGFYWCGTNTSCAANYVFDNAYGYYGGAVAGVLEIPVNSVTKLW